MKTTKRIITALLALILLAGCGGKSAVFPPEEPPEDLNEGTESMVVDEDFEIETNDNEDVGGF